MSTETGVMLSGIPSLNRSRRKVLEEGMPWTLCFYFLPRQATAVAIGTNGKKKGGRKDISINLISAPTFTVAEFKIKFWVPFTEFGEKE